jgi:hypothetical protein
MVPRSLNDRFLERPLLQDSPRHIRFDLRGWAAIATGLALLVAVTFLAIGLFIFFLPVLILAPVLYWLMPKPKIYRVSNPTSEKTTKGTTIIDGEFRVIDAGVSGDDSRPTDFKS